MSTERTIEYLSLGADLNREEQIKNFIAQARAYRHEYNDELRPDLLTREVPGYYKFKTRSNIFNGVTGMLELLLERSYITDGELREDISGFVRYYTHTRPKGHDLRYTQEDLGAFNGILDKVIAHLEAAGTTEQG